MVQWLKVQLHSDGWKLSVGEHTVMNTEVEVLYNVVHMKVENK